MSKLRVWHIPQVPMKAFIVEVDTVAEGVRLMDALANYDQFQFDNNVKPDYCNANGLQMWDSEITDDELVEMGLDDRWVDWYIDDETACFDDPREYVEHLESLQAE